MKLEYLADGSPECPLIRLFEFTTAEVAAFMVAIGKLARGDVDRVDVHNLPFVQSLGDCQLVFTRLAADQAVRRVENEFQCGLTSNTWDNVLGFVEPFARNATGFQWLASSPGEANLLLSTNGDW